MRSFLKLIIDAPQYDAARKALQDVQLLPQLTSTITRQAPLPNA